MEQEQEQQQEQQQEMLGVLSLVPALDQRVAVFRCPIKPQLFSTWLITAPASCSQPEQSTVASFQFRDITFQTVSSVSSSYLLPPAVCRVHTGHWVHYLYLSLPVVRSSAPLHHWSWPTPSAAQPGHLNIYTSRLQGSALVQHQIFLDIYFFLYHLCLMFA